MYCDNFSCKIFTFCVVGNDLQSFPEATLPPRTLAFSRRPPSETTVFIGHRTGMVTVVGPILQDGNVLPW